MSTKDLGRELRRIDREQVNSGNQSLPVVIIEHETGNVLANCVRMPIQQLKAKRFLEYGLFGFSLSLKRHLLSCPDRALGEVPPSKGMSGPALVARGMRRCTAPPPWVSNLIITVTGRELEQSIFELYDLLSSDGQNTLEDEVVGSTPTHGIRIQYYVSASR